MCKNDFKRIIGLKEIFVLFCMYVAFYIYLYFSASMIVGEGTKNFFIRLFFVDIDFNGQMNMFFFIIPLICGIISNELFAYDVRSGMYVFVVNKIGARKYIYQKAITTFLLGGTFIISFYIIDILIKMAIYPMNKPSILRAVNMLKGPLSDIWTYHTWIYVVIALVVTFLFAGLCSLVSFTFSLFNQSKFLVPVFPFVLNYFAWNVVNIFNIKDYTFSNIVKFQEVAIDYSIFEYCAVFGVVFLICLITIILKARKYDFK